MKKVITATEIRENWERTHDVDCDCELCYCRAAIKAKSDAILKPLIERVLVLLRKQDIFIGEIK